VGDSTAWPFDVGRPATEFTDGLSNTIFVVETTGRAIAWTEPRDLDFDQLDFDINGPTDYGMASARKEGANALMADGAVRFFSTGIMPATLRALLTPDGGEPISP
jgi:prepilin-type processing-associated H-X9-DG protein